MCNQPHICIIGKVKAELRNVLLTTHKEIARARERDRNKYTNAHINTTTCHILTQTQTDTFTYLLLTNLTFIHSFFLFALIMIFIFRDLVLLCSFFYYALVQIILKIFSFIYIYSSRSWWLISIMNDILHITWYIWILVILNEL